MNEDRALDQKTKYEVKGHMLLVNNQQVKSPFTMPSVTDMLSPTEKKKSQTDFTNRAGKNPARER